MSLASVVLRQASETITVIRKPPTVVDADGIVQAPGSVTTLTVSASVQPAVGQDLQYLPEGSFAKDAQVVFTAVPLQTANEGDGTAPDLVVRANGTTYAVISVQDWSAAGGFWRSVILKRVGT